MKKSLSMASKVIEGQNISYCIFGEGDIDLVIEMGLGAVAGEWLHIAEQLSKQFTVLLYERGRNISKARSPKNIAKELHALLMELPCKSNITILAHSQGGLYAQQFARMYPDMVRGIVFVDPLSANDNKYKSVFLTSDEQKKSGFNKSENFVIMRKMASCHLGFLIKLFMRKAPPFYYYDQFSLEAKKYILDELTKVEFHDAALEEYRLAHEEKEISHLKEKGNFPQIPIVLITHGSEFEIKEIMEFGQTTKAFAEKVEALWQSLMQEYLTFSKHSILLRADNSGHYIHLTDFEVIMQALECIMQQRTNENCEV
ncbi:alpha/beta hydrolase [Butyrivibrio sp. VCD2006]|uniref:alpha/beta hydrolase n=1 Tax=Butyrivibrio sp. VCD2006 TaxID=1280664 RepID=UPI0003FE75ED|nr:alpha/beta hydrolase [Butyrivibrio sp. VCD2006]